MKVGIPAFLNGWERDNNDKHRSPPPFLLIITSFQIQKLSVRIALMTSFPTLPFTGRYRDSCSPYAPRVGPAQRIDFQIDRPHQVLRPISFFSTLLIHRDRLLSKFHSCAPCGTESSVPFSTDRRPGHPEFLHAILLDTMRCLSMPLQGRPPRSEYRGRKSCALPAVHRGVLYW